MQRILWVFFIGFLCSLARLSWAADVWNVPSFEAVRAAWQPSHTQVLARDGVVLQQLRTDFAARRGQWVALADVSAALRVALLLSEDRRFAAHAGVDVWAVGRAALARWEGQQHSASGASTVTMQLAALLNEDLRLRGSGRRNWGQKLAQAALALRLEQSWTKAQILEAYLNLLPFRGELVGVDALARTLFGRAPHALNATESAIAAALVRSPNARAQMVGQRACVLAGQLQALDASALEKMGFLHLDDGPVSLPQLALQPPRRGGDAAMWLSMKGMKAANTRVRPSPALGLAGQWQGGRPRAGLVSGAAPSTCAGFEARAERVLSARLWAGQDGDNLHVARQALSQARTWLARWDATGELSHWPVANIRTTLDARAQAQAISHLRRQLRELQGRHVQDGAVVVLDNASGQVRAWVGSSGPLLSAAPEFDAVRAPRQVGSTLKPFLYAQALGQRRLTAAALIEDSAAHIDTGAGLYVPQNYDRSFRGWVSVRQALAASLNVPAVRVLGMVGADAFAEQLAALGLHLPHSAEHYGLSLALGSAEFSLLQLTNAYRTLANGGWHSPSAALVVGIALHCPADAASSRRLMQHIQQMLEKQGLLAPTQAPEAAPSLLRPTSPKAVLGRGQPLQLTACDRVWHVHDVHEDFGGDGGQAIDAAAAFIVRDILSDNAARAPTFGLRSALHTHFDSAVKTGTSKDLRDNWAIGFDARHTVGVWVGNADGSPMHAVSGTSGAAPVWAQVLGDLHGMHDGQNAFAINDLPSFATTARPPNIPSDVLRQRVDFVWARGQPPHCADAAPDKSLGFSGLELAALEPSRLEWFIAGTQMSQAVAVHPACQVSQSATSTQNDFRASRPQKGFFIAWPQNGTMLALDPDIGPTQQRLWLRAGAAHHADHADLNAGHLRWRLQTRIWKNGVENQRVLDLGTGPRIAWLPLPGRHTLELLDAHGQVLDSVHIQVRGAVEKMPE